MTCEEWKYKLHSVSPKLSPIRFLPNTTVMNADANSWYKILMFLLHTIWSEFCCYCWFFLLCQYLDLSHTLIIKSGQYMIDHTQLYKILRMTNVVSKLQERPFNRRPTARLTIDVWATSEHAWIDPGSVRGPEMNMFEQVCSGHIWTIWGHTDRQTWLKTLPSR